MKAIANIVSKVVFLPMDDVDTDQIIPARYMTTIERDGLGKFLFADWRYLPDGRQNPEFILNEPAVEGAEFLLAGANFGCGSSREHAVWALVGWGFRAVIALSFADIFRANALKNGLLPIIVDDQAHAELLATFMCEPVAMLTVDLPTQCLTLPGGRSVYFPIDSFAKRCLIEGLDELGYLLSFEEQIKAYEQKKT